jgi:hypothetical protein
MPAMLDAEQHPTRGGARSDGRAGRIKGPRQEKEGTSCIRGDGQAFSTSRRLPLPSCLGAQLSPDTNATSTPNAELNMISLGLILEQLGLLVNSACPPHGNDVERPVILAACACC